MKSMCLNHLSTILWAGGKCRSPIYKPSILIYLISYMVCCRVLTKSLTTNQTFHFLIRVTFYIMIQLLAPNKNAE